jgi:hypothetical protein
MSYETADYINELNKNLPAATDSISEGDIHLRMIKDVLKKSFPSVSAPVNVIHGPSEPSVTSAGTVWFDYEGSGLVKMRDSTNSHWLNMAHGEAPGFGQLLKQEWIDWGQTFSYRYNVPTKIKSHMVNPLSATSEIIIQLTASAGSWGANTHNQTWGQFRDVTNDVDINEPVRLVGFNHVDDPGNFEVYSSVSMVAKYSSHPADSFELGLYSWSADAHNGGADMQRVICQTSELE